MSTANQKRQKNAKRSEKTSKREETGLTVTETVTEEREDHGDYELVTKRTKTKGAFGRISKKLEKKLSRGVRQTISTFVELFFIFTGALFSLFITMAVVVGVYPPIVIGMLQNIQVPAGASMMVGIALTIIPAFMIGLLLVVLILWALWMVWGFIATRRKHIRYFFVPDSAEKKTVTKEYKEKKK